MSRRTLPLALGLAVVGHTLARAQQAAPQAAEIHRDEVHLRNLRQLTF